MKELITYFNKLSILSKNSNDLILQSSGIFKFKKNDIITSHKDHERFLYIVKSGLVRSFDVNNGNEATLNIWMENEIFGDIIYSTLEDQMRSTYEAVEAVEVYRISLIDLKSLYDTNHEICNLGRKIAEIYIDQQEKIKCILRSESANEKYRLFLKYRPGIISRAKLKHIASFIDISPETLSRIRKLELQN